MAIKKLPQHEVLDDDYGRLSTFNKINEVIDAINGIEEMPNVKQDVVNLKSDMSAAQGDITALEGDMDIIDTQILALQESNSARTSFYDRFWPKEGHEGKPFKALPVDATPAYYPYVIFDESAPFSPDNTHFYKYCAVYGGVNGGEGRMAFSNDGIAFTAPEPLAGLTGKGYHAAIAYDGTKLHIWYWIGTMNNDIADVRHATSDPSEAQTFDNDEPIQEETEKQFVTGSDESYRQGTYGPSWIEFNPNATNEGDNPLDYSFYGFFTVTSKLKEHSVFAYSEDGITWIRYQRDLAEDEPWIISKPEGYTKHCVHQVFPIWDKYTQQWVIYFTATSVWPNNQMVGLGTARHLLDKVDILPEPIYRVGMDIAYGERCYCPCAIYDENGDLLLYKTGKETDMDGGHMHIYVSTFKFSREKLPVAPGFTGDFEDNGNTIHVVDGRIMSVTPV